MIIYSIVGIEDFYSKFNISPFYASKFIFYPAETLA